MADVELYYREPPPESVRSAVERIIEVQVPVYNREHWLGLFECDQLHPYYFCDSEADYRSDEEVIDYCEKMAHFSRGNWSEDARDVPKERLVEIFSRFQHESCLHELRGDGPSQTSQWLRALVVHVGRTTFRSTIEGAEH